MNNSLLYFKHFCMQGYETGAPYLDKDDQDLYQGTAKSAEGLVAEHVFALAKQDTMHIVASSLARCGLNIRKGFQGTLS